MTTWASTSASQPPLAPFSILKAVCACLSICSTASLSAIAARKSSQHTWRQTPSDHRRHAAGKEHRPAALLGPDSSATGVAEGAGGRWQCGHGSSQQVTLRRDPLGVAGCPPAAAGAQRRGCEGCRSPRRRRLAVLRRTVNLLVPPPSQGAPEPHRAKGYQGRCRTRPALPPSLLQGRITLIYKCKGADRESPASYRPITLLNTDYKLAARTLASRQGPVLNHIVDAIQTGFLPKRWVGDVLAHLEEISYFFCVHFFLRKMYTTVLGKAGNPRSALKSLISPFSDVSLRNFVPQRISRGTQI